MSWDTTLKARSTKRSRPRVPALRVLFCVDRVVREEPRLLEAGTTDLGRAVEEGIALPDDPRVSRKHASLEVSGDGARVWLVDESSTGTWVDGERIDRAELRDGAVIRVGDSMLVFRRLPRDGHDRAIDGLLGDAPVMRNLRSTLELVGPSDATVLLLGESGTGKEVAARALHHLSGRRGPFVAVNCGASPEALAESQLFGHVAGAYTGAKGESDGFFRAADGGTLFLDEVGELPLTVQPKLLRVLEDRAVTPVGATKATPCDIRVITATNRDLVEAVGCGGFRGDLYSRIGEFTIELPPLRERPEDVLMILQDRLAESLPMSPELAEALLRHSWPFNVRELVKVAVQLRVRGGASDRLELDMVQQYLERSASVRPPTVRDDATTTAERPRAAPPGVPAGSVPDRDELEELLRRHRGVIADVAREAGRSRKQVYRWLDQHGLDAKNWRSDESA